LRIKLDPNPNHLNEEGLCYEGAPTATIRFACSASSGS